MAIIELLDRLITERGSAAVMEKHIAFLKIQFEALEKQVEHLQEENAELKASLGKCEEDRAAQARVDEFVEHRGALFKRKPEGGYHLGVYCPKCRHSAGNGGDHDFPFQCSGCGFFSNFSGGELQGIMRELP